MKELPAIVRALLEPAAGASVLATLATVEGSSYRRPGARLLLTADGRRLGSISGGCLEEDIVVRARNVLATGIAESVVYDTTSENDLVWGVGLGCHGVVRVVLEKLPPRPAWAVALAENFAARRPALLAVTHLAATATPARSASAPAPSMTESPAPHRAFVTYYVTNSSIDHPRAPGRLCHVLRDKRRCEGFTP